MNFGARKLHISHSELLDKEFWREIKPTVEADWALQLGLVWEAFGHCGGL
jgi:hypothetical protein